ncbi:hypothetical protein HN51_069512, partial [Arachis hypogaea]
MMEILAYSHQSKATQELFLSDFLQTVKAFPDALFHQLLVAMAHPDVKHKLEHIDLTLTLSTFLPVVSINNDSKDQSDFSIRLKMYNEVQRCFLTVGLVYPDDLFLFLVNKCKVKEETLTFGGLCVLKHLLPSKIPLLVEAVKSLLEEPSLGVRKVLSELIVVMASHCYLVSSSGELFIEYLVRHCALTDNNRGDLDILNKRVE